MNDRLAVVTGAGGFIGFHLAKQLRELGWKVRGIDVKCPEFDNPAICADQFWYCDLRDSRECDHVVRGAERVYHFAADMGGIGYIGTQTATIAANNALIDAHMLLAAADAGVKRFFFPSSACVYRQLAQRGTNAVPFRSLMRCPLIPNLDMAGLNSSPSSYALIFAKTGDYELMWLASTMSMANGARFMEGAKRHPPPFAASLLNCRKTVAK